MTCVTRNVVYVFERSSRWIRNPSRSSPKKPNSWVAGTCLMEHNSITIIIAAFHGTRNIIRPALQHFIQAKLIQNLRWFLNLSVTDYIIVKEHNILHTVHTKSKNMFFPTSFKEATTNQPTNQQSDVISSPWWNKQRPPPADLSRLGSVHRLGEAKGVSTPVISTCYRSLTVSPWRQN